MRPRVKYASAAAAVLGALIVSISCAYATSERVKSACKDDYFRYCSAHALGSPDLRQCMRGVGEGLSNPCLAALALDGEVTKEDIQRYQAHAASAGKAASGEAAPKRSVSIGETAKGEKKKSTMAGKTASKVASVGKASHGGKAGTGKFAKAAATSGKTSKVASAGKTSREGKAGAGKVATGGNKTTKVASDGKTAKKLKAGHATKASDASQTKTP